MFRNWIISMFYSSYKQPESVGGLFRRLAIRVYPDLAGLSQHIDSNAQKAVAATQRGRVGYKDCPCVMEMVRQAEKYDMDLPLFIGIHSLNNFLDVQQVELLVAMTYRKPNGSPVPPSYQYLQAYTTILYRIPELGHICNLHETTYDGRRYYVLSNTIERLKELNPWIDTATIYNTLEIRPCPQSSL